MNAAHGGGGVRLCDIASDRQRKPLSVPKTFRDRPARTSDLAYALAILNKRLRPSGGGGGRTNLDADERRVPNRGKAVPCRARETSPHAIFSDVLAARGKRDDDAFGDT